MRTTISSTPAHALAVGMTVWLMSGAVDVALAQTARQIIDATGIQGGLIVHIGCGDGKLTASLCQDDRCIVQGLDLDAKNVEKARERIRETETGTGGNGDWRP